MGIQSIRTQIDSFVGRFGLNKSFQVVQEPPAGGEKLPAKGPGDDFEELIRIGAAVDKPKHQPRGDLEQDSRAVILRDSLIAERNFLAQSTAPKSKERVKQLNAQIGILTKHKDNPKILEDPRLVINRKDDAYQKLIKAYDPAKPANKQYVPYSNSTAIVTASGNGSTPVVDQALSTLLGTPFLDGAYENLLKLSDKPSESVYEAFRTAALSKGVAYQDGKGPVNYAVPMVSDRILRPDEKPIEEGSILYISSSADHNGVLGRIDRKLPGAIKLFLQDLPKDKQPNYCNIRTGVNTEEQMLKAIDEAAAFCPRGKAVTIILNTHADILENEPKDFLPPAFSHLQGSRETYMQFKDELVTSHKLRAKLLAHEAKGVRFNIIALGCKTGGLIAEKNPQHNIEFFKKTDKV